MALRQGGRGRPTRRPSRGFSPGPALSQLHAPHVLLLLPGTPSQHLTPPSSPLPVPPVQPRLKVSGQTRCCLGFSRLGGLPLLDAPRRPLPDTRHSVTDLSVLTTGPATRWGRLILSLACWLVPGTWRCPWHSALAQGGLCVTVVESSDILGRCWLCRELLWASATTSNVGDKAAAVTSDCHPWHCPVPFNQRLWGPAHGSVENPCE